MLDLFLQVEFRKVLIFCSYEFKILDMLKSVYAFITVQLKFFSVECWED